MSNPPISDLATRTKSIENFRQTRREIAEFNQELAEIEAQLDRELCIKNYYGLVKLRQQPR